jgi:hypothetical protein
MKTKQIQQLSNEHEVVQSLRHILVKLDQLALPTGKVGADFLDALEVTDKIRTKARDKAKELLLNGDPNALPGWYAIKVYPMREIAKDIFKVYEALHEADGSLTGEAFAKACTTNLTAIRRLVVDRYPDWDTDTVERFLNHSLRDVIGYKEGYSKLMRKRSRNG